MASSAWNLQNSLMILFEKLKKIFVNFRVNKKYSILKAQK